MTARTSERTVIETRNDNVDLDSIATSNASSWAAKELTLYHGNSEDLLEDASKLMMVGDPSTHAGEETLFGAVYAWEKEEAVYGLPQVIAQAKHVSPYEFEMSEDLRAKAAARKVDRVSSLREWQSLSSMLCHSSKKSMDNFDVPEDTVLRRPGENELRVVGDSDPHVTKCWMVDRSTNPNVWTRTLPDDQHPGSWNQLTICLDSGSIGRAGASFAKNELKLNIFPIWDVIHRLIRDIRLSSEKAAGGMVQKALLHSGFIWSIHSKPYGSGVWFFTKQEMLKHFMETHDSTHWLFRRFAPLIARDVNPQMTLVTDDDFEALWQMLPELPGFTEKLEPIKLMRWFSANGRRKTECKSFWVFKMILIDHFGLECDLQEGQTDDPPHITGMTPKQELQALKSMGGGFKLAEKMICFWLHWCIRVYYYSTQTYWSLYTDHTKKVKGPAENLIRIIQMSQGRWTVQLRDMFDNSFRNSKNLEDMGLDWSAHGSDLVRQQPIVDTLVAFNLHLAGNRSCSMLAYEELQ